MLLAAAVPTLVGLALLVATVAGVEVLVRSGPATTFPWPVLSELRAGLTLALLAGGWLLTNAPYEGRVLLALSRGHGLTVADLLAVPPLALAATLVVRRLL